MEKPIIVFDLDQTLISAEALEEFDVTKHKEKMAKFEFSNMEGYYVIFHRPHLQEFLDFAFANFKVMVWTAATKDYALYVIDNVLKYSDKGSDRMLELILFDYHCKLSEKKCKSPKDLSALNKHFKLAGYNLDRICIIDDYDAVYNPQKKNCILVKPFFFMDNGSENDTYLLELKEKLQKGLESTKDISILVENINTSGDVVGGGKKVEGVPANVSTSSDQSTKEKKEKKEQVKEKKSVEKKEQEKEKKEDTKEEILVKPSTKEKK